MKRILIALAVLSVLTPAVLPVDAQGSGGSSPAPSAPSAGTPAPGGSSTQPTKSGKRHRMLKRLHRSKKQTSPSQ